MMRGDSIVGQKRTGVFVTPGFTPAVLPDRSSSCGINGVCHGSTTPDETFGMRFEGWQNRVDSPRRPS